MKHRPVPYNLSKEAERPQLQIPLAPPDWYLEKLEHEKIDDAKEVVTHEIDYTIQPGTSCIIIKDI